MCRFQFRVPMAFNLLFITSQNVPLLENTRGFLAVHEIWQSTLLKHDNFSDIVTYCKGYPSFLNYTNQTLIYISFTYCVISGVARLVISSVAKRGPLVIYFIPSCQTFQQFSENLLNSSLKIILCHQSKWKITDKGLVFS